MSSKSPVNFFAIKRSLVSFFYVCLCSCTLLRPASLKSSVLACTRQKHGPLSVHVSLGHSVDSQLEIQFIMPQAPCLLTKLRWQTAPWLPSCECAFVTSVGHRFVSIAVRILHTKIYLCENKNLADLLYRNHQADTVD